jgi:4'-phosphopantetheinyl transferase
MSASSPGRPVRCFSEGSVEVFLARLDLHPDAVQQCAAVLCGNERARAGRFRFEPDRARFMVARARLRELLAERLGTRPESVELEYGPNGKPALVRRPGDADWRFNLAHCDDVALYALCRGRDVGIDIEAIRAVDEVDKIASRFFSAAEHAAYRALSPQERPLGFLRCWTRKEALVKAVGEGLSMPLEAFEVSLAPDARDEVVHFDATAWRLTSFQPMPGYVAALATRH